MDEYKPITGELRKAFMANGGIATLDGCIIKEYMTIAKSELDDLCDNIDSVHARLEHDFDRLKAERDSMAAALDAAQGEHAYAPESHYMMLPKDADGVPVHVGDVMDYAGDVMEWIDPGGDYSLTCEVCAVGIDCFFAWDKINGRFAQKDARAYRHYHAPTVEDVLTEFAAKLIEHGGLTNGAAQTIAEYAAKLRLAGEK